MFNLFDDRSSAAGTDAGLALLRLALGVVFIAHSAYLKLMVFTLPGTAAFFESLGLPAFSAYVVFAVEAIGGVLLIAGVLTRLTALALTFVSAGAAWAHLGAGWLFTNTGGGWEYPVFLVATSAVLVLTGPGRLTVQALLRDRNAQTAAVPA